MAAKYDTSCAPFGRAHFGYTSEIRTVPPARHIPYGVAFVAGRSFGGCTIPSRLEAGWWYGTEKYTPVVRGDITWAEFS